MLRVMDLTFDYDQNRKAKVSPIIDHLSFELSAYDRVYLSAPSGAGKTTLCKLAAGYLKPWSGEVEVDGMRLIGKGACPVQMIHQHPEHVLDPRCRMKDSLLEAGWDPEDEHDGSVIERLGIKEEWLMRFPHELSGGELQRFCIARVLLAQPRYIIADEITTMLDAVSQVQIWKMLLEEVECQGLGMLFTTHSPALAKEIATRTMEL